MSHTIEDKTKLLEQVGRLRRQAQAIEDLLAKSVDCEEIMVEVAGARSIVDELAAEVGDDHDAAHA